MSIWALLADSLNWCHHDAAKICLLVTGVINMALATVGVVYVTDILAQCPAGFDIVHILFTLSRSSQYVMQPTLNALDNAYDSSKTTY